MSFLKKFPSYDMVFKSALAALQRFPLALLSALVGTIAAVTLADSPPHETELVVQRLVITAALGLPLFIALATFGETRGWARGKSLAVQAIGVVALVGYFFTQPADVGAYNLPIVRFVLLAAALHFLVAFLPFLQKGKMNAFWQYNKTLFLRFLTAALYSAVMYIGLTLALAAADYLFGADVPEKAYFQLWILIVGIFNTWLFLAGVPGNLRELVEVTDYPNGLKVFTQFILLPLVGLYFVILFAYELKIIFEWNWPKGWVSNMVLWYSVVGMLSMLLLHPLREQTENRWIQAFFRWFFRALVPLVVMLFLAISVRVSEYGVTENRYFVLAMAIGLSLVVLYFIFSKARDIRIIPIVLCVIALVSAYGPWSAFSASASSQMSRLDTFLAKNKLQVATVPSNAEVPSEDRVEMSSIIRHLNDWQGMKPFRALLGDSLSGALDTLPRYTRSEQIAEHLGFTLSYSIRGSEDGRRYFHLRFDSAAPVPVTGYNVMVSLDDAGPATQRRMAMPDGDSLLLSFDSVSAGLSVEWHSGGEVTGQAQFELADTLLILAEVADQKPLEQADLTFTTAGDGLDALMILQRVSGNGDDSSVTITSFSAQLLIRKQ